MESKIMQVFYGNDCLPYKDKERTIHYPIVGSTFTGANNTTQIRFYLRDVGGVFNIAWLCSVKLANGKLGYQLLPSNTKVYDSTLGEYYLPLDLSSFYTQAKGDIFISLNGYDGNADVTYNEDTSLWEISGSPAIQVTGSIKITINYAPQSLQTTEIDEDVFNAVLEALSSKIDNIDTIFICRTTLSALASDNNFEDGQVVYYTTDHKFYKWDLANSQFNEISQLQISNSLKLTNVNDLQAVSAGIEELTVGDESANVWLNVIKVNGVNKLVISNELYESVEVNVDGTISATSFQKGGKELATEEYVDNGHQVTLTGTSGTISSATDKAALTHDNSSIKIGTLVYRLTAVSGNDRTFGVYYLTDNNNGVLTLQRQYVSVNTSTGVWSLDTDDLDSTYDKSYIDSTLGHSISIDNNYVLKLLDKTGTTISSIDLPLESIVTSAQFYETYTYDGTTYTDVIVITLATTSVPTIIPVGDLVSGLVSTSDLTTALDGYVPTSRKVADIALSSDISKQDLTDALVYSNTTTDLDYVFTD